MKNEALLVDIEGKPNRMLQMEAKLKEQQSEIHRLKSIIDELPGSVYWKNKAGVYLGQNTFAKERMQNTHLYQGPITGKTDHEIFSKEEADIYRLNDLEVMAEGMVSSKEEIVKLPTGEILTQLSIKRPLRDEEGNIIGVIGNTVDITYSKKIEKELREAKEKAERANQFKTEIIRHMEHDIRTPFGGIWILSNMLMEQEEDAHKKECLRDISGAAKELLDYCNSMLEFIKMENISSPILNEHFDLKDLIDRTFLIEKVAAKCKNIKLEFDSSIRTSMIIIGDGKRISQLLLNLISNAIKFTDLGYVKLTANFIKKIDEQKSAMQFIIEDSGVGLPVAEKKYILECSENINESPFIKPSSKNGTGLVTVKRLINELQGRIEVESELGKGTKFICTLPCNLSLDA